MEQVMTVFYHLDTGDLAGGANGIQNKYSYYARATDEFLKNLGVLELPFNMDFFTNYPAYSVDISSTPHTLKKKGN